MILFKKSMVFSVFVMMTFCGCATVREVSPSSGSLKVPPVSSKPPEASRLSQEALRSATSEESQKPADLKKSSDSAVSEEGTGLIFAKTDFQGVLKTNYVKLIFEDQKNPDHVLELYIGDKSKQGAFPWEGKTVEPGYFFMELPAGRYKITRVIIPVGSTTAEESLDIDLEVRPDTALYVGTLRMIGTKEKIKLGGVPVIKPGFEYTVDIIDEQEQGRAVFKKYRPQWQGPVDVNLMRVNPVKEK